MVFTNREEFFFNDRNDGHKITQNCSLYGIFIYICRPNENTLVSRRLLQFTRRLPWEVFL